MSWCLLLSSRFLAAQSTGGGQLNAIVNCHGPKCGGHWLVGRRIDAFRIISSNAIHPVMYKIRLSM
jgi:hypothetical protein